MLTTRHILAAGIAIAAATSLLHSQTIYVSNGYAIEKFAPDGSRSAFSTVVGGVSPSGTERSLLALDGGGNLYAVAGDFPATIERFTPDGAGSTFAAADPFATGAAFDSAGNLYVQSFNWIRRYAPDGSSSPFASWNGSFADMPGGIALDKAGNLWVDKEQSNVVARLAPDGTPLLYITGGAAVNQPMALACDAAGNVYVGNWGNNTIGKITPDGVESVFASVGVSGPGGLAFDGAGNLYVLNSGSDTIEVFGPDGVGRTFATDVPGGWIAIQPTPEPATLLLLALGGLALLRRKAGRV